MFDNTPPWAIATLFNCSSLGTANANSRAFQHSETDNLVGTCQM